MSRTRLFNIIDPIVGADPEFVEVQSINQIIDFINAIPYLKMQMDEAEINPKSAKKEEANHPQQTHLTEKFKVHEKKISPVAFYKLLQEAFEAEINFVQKHTNIAGYENTLWYLHTEAQRASYRKFFEDFNKYGNFAHLLAEELVIVAKLIEYLSDAIDHTIKVLSESSEVKNLNWPQRFKVLMDEQASLESYRQQIKACMRKHLEANEQSLAHPVTVSKCFPLSFSVGIEDNIIPDKRQNNDILYGPQSHIAAIFGETYAPKIAFLDVGLQGTTRQYLLDATKTQVQPVHSFFNEYLNPRKKLKLPEISLTVLLEKCKTVIHDHLSELHHKFSHLIAKGMYTKHEGGSNPHKPCALSNPEQERRFHLWKEIAYKAAMQLKAEIFTLQHSRFTLFTQWLKPDSNVFGGKIATKEAKFAALIEITIAENYADLIKRVNQFRENKVIRKGITSRTADIIDAILAETPPEQFGKSIFNCFSAKKEACLKR